MGIAGIGTAPVSFGVYGTPDSHTSPLTLLDCAVEAGYRGMELGPPGFFGTPAATAAAFAERGLAVIGAYVPIHFSADDETVARDLTGLKRTLDELVAAGPGPGLAILADAGSPELESHPARRPEERHLALDDTGWRRLADGVAMALDLARAANVPTSFHPHIGTFVESAWEVERLMEMTPVSLTLDTGHCWLAGSDPVELLGRFGDRVRHVHLKDVRRAVLERAKREGRSDFEIWWAEVSTPLGSGDVDLERFIGALLDHDYAGWLVIEQDRLPLGDTPIEAVTSEQARNWRWVDTRLRALGVATDASTMDAA